MTRSRTLGIVLILALIITVVIAVGVAAEDVKIHACVNPSGQPRIAEGPDDCSVNETYLVWNVTGPQGPEGPEGSPAALNFYERREVCIWEELLPGGIVTCRVLCDDGDLALSGGYSINTGGDDLIVPQQFVRSPERGWYIWAQNQGASTSTSDNIWIHAYCLDQ